MLASTGTAFVSLDLLSASSYLDLQHIKPVLIVERSAARSAEILRYDARCENPGLITRP